MLIAVDHGNKQIKTVHTPPFTSGLIQSDTPGFGTDALAYSDAMIASYLDDRPCSVLEMMIALSIRCEEHIMDDPDIGNRTGQWFWSMLVSLGIGAMDDRKFDRYFVDRTLERFLDREYERNGEGGLFTVNNGRDMRRTEIWYQMQYHLGEIIQEGDI